MMWRRVCAVLLGAWVCSCVEADYSKEADAFLEAMPAGLQQGQCEAIGEALTGDLVALDAVRNRRNSAEKLNEDVAVRELSPMLRLYTPRSPKSEKLPVLVYLHGGGWTIGSQRSCARYCAELTATGRVTVVAVEYRLAPEYPYPCGLEDCVEAYVWTHNHAAEWGGDSRRVAVGGDSSGGNLAVATCLSLMQKGQESPYALLLYYPVVSAWNDGSESWLQYAQGAALDGDLMEAFNRAYCEGVDHAVEENPHTNPLISPSVAEDQDLAQLPRTMLLAADRDILKDQGRKFASRLQDLGVDIERDVLAGTVHLFITVKGQERAFREAVHRASEFLQ